MRHICPLLLLLAAAPQQQAPPTFRSDVRVVGVDVSVLDAQRHPITGLRAEDFIILEDGLARPLVAFAAIEHSEQPSAATLPASLRGADKDPEAASPGRIVGMVMPFAIRNEQTTMVRQIARTIVNRLDAGDLGMVIVPGRSGAWTATSDKAALLRRVDAPLYSLAGGEEGNRGRDMCGTAFLDAMSAFAESVQDAPARRKIMFAIGASLRFTEMSVCSGTVAESRRRLFHALRAANVTVYSMDPTGLETLQKDATVQVREGAQSNGRLDRTGVMQFNLERQGNLAVLPAMTGGRTLVNANTPDAFVHDIFAETASYYLLGFEPATSAHGRVHAIKVQVKHRDAIVVARTEWDTR